MGWSVKGGSQKDRPREEQAIRHGNPPLMSRKDPERSRKKPAEYLKGPPRESATETSVARFVTDDCLCHGKVLKYKRDCFNGIPRTCFH